MLFSVLALLEHTCSRSAKNPDFYPSGTPSLRSRRAIFEKYMSNKVHICFIYTSHLFDIYLTNICFNTIFCFGPFGTPYHTEWVREFRQKRTHVDVDVWGGVDARCISFATLTVHLCGAAALSSRKRTALRGYRSTRGGETSGAWHKAVRPCITSHFLLKHL